MAVGLRKIAEHAAGHGIELFRQQAHVIAVRKQTIEQLPRLRITALHYVIVDKPEAASQECSLAGRQAIVDIAGFVAQDEFVTDQELVLDGEAFPVPSDRWRGESRRAE